MLGTVLHATGKYEESSNLSINTQTVIKSDLDQKRLAYSLYKLNKFKESLHYYNNSLKTIPITSVILLLEMVCLPKGV